jgi:hypothetical protein
MRRGIWSRASSRFVRVPITDDLELSNSVLEHWVRDVGAAVLDRIVDAAWPWRGFARLRNWRYALFARDAGAHPVDERRKALNGVAQRTS